MGTTAGHSRRGHRRPIRVRAWPGPDRSLRSSSSCRADKLPGHLVRSVGRVVEARARVERDGEDVPVGRVVGHRHPHGLVRPVEGAGGRSRSAPGPFPRDAEACAWARRPFPTVAVAPGGGRATRDGALPTRAIVATAPETRSPSTTARLQRAEERPPGAGAGKPESPGSLRAWSGRFVRSLDRGCGWAVVPSSAPKHRRAVHKPRPDIFAIYRRGPPGMARGSRLPPGLVGFKCRVGTGRA